MALTTKEIALEYTKRYGINIADGMQNAKIDQDCFGPFSNVEKLNDFFDEMEKLSGNPDNVPKERKSK